MSKKSNFALLIVVSVSPPNWLSSTLRGLLQPMISSMWQKVRLEGAPGCLASWCLREPSVGLVSISPHTEH